MCHSASHEIRLLLWNHSDSLPCSQEPACRPNMNQMDPVHAVPPSLFKIQFSIDGCGSGLRPSAEIEKLVIT